MISTIKHLLIFDCGGSFSLFFTMLHKEDEEEEEIPVIGKLVTKEMILLSYCLYI